MYVLSNNHALATIWSPPPPPFLHKRVFHMGHKVHGICISCFKYTYRDVFPSFIMLLKLCVGGGQAPERPLYPAAASRVRPHLEMWCRQSPVMDRSDLHHNSAAQTPRQLASPTAETPTLTTWRGGGGDEHLTMSSNVLNSPWLAFLMKCSHDAIKKIKNCGT